MPDAGTSLQRAMTLNSQQRIAAIEAWCRVQDDGEFAGRWAGQALF